MLTSEQRKKWHLDRLYVDYCEGLTYSLSTGAGVAGTMKCTDNEHCIEVEHAAAVAQGAFDSRYPMHFRTRAELLQAVRVQLDQEEGPASTATPFPSCKMIKALPDDVPPSDPGEE